jgi:outer membrane immunogenic protein
MKRILLGSMALVALGMAAAPATAADMPVKVKAPPPVVVYDWSGAYVGFNVGATWYEVDRFYPNIATADHRVTGNDGIYGFHAGAQWQWGQIVLGVEAALSGCFRECRSTLQLPSPPFTATDVSETKITTLFTVGPRLGFAWDRWMIYGTGGYAYGAIKATYCNSATNLCGPAGGFLRGDSQNHGWYAGGGFEYMVHKGPLVDVILGAEYQHYELDTKKGFCSNASCAPPTLSDWNQKAQGDIVRARLTIKTQAWGWAGPWK